MRRVMRCCCSSILEKGRRKSERKCGRKEGDEERERERKIMKAVK